MKKRFIALLLCCVMIFTLSPSLIASAAADDETVQQVEQTSEAKDTDQQPEQQPDQAQNEDKNETQATEEPKTEEPMPEEPKIEEPKAEEPKAEEPKAEDETTIPAAEQPGAPVESEIITPTVNFTNVAPFLPPVTGIPVRSNMFKMGVRSLAMNEATDNGIVLNKTATANDNDTYTITLEAYATGSKVISEVKEDVPTDIVLVLDQSGSMAHCIVCGNEINGWNKTHNIYQYTEFTNNPDNYKYYTFYIKVGSTYAQVYYCDGRHWRNDCEGGAGWYTSPSLEDHTAAAKITPKTTENPDGVQFYTRQPTGTERCTSRLSALKTAVTTFANSVAEKAKGKDGELGTTDDVNHRVAVVGFANCGTNMSYENTEIFIGNNAYGYGNAAQGIYGTAFQDMSTNAGKNNVLASVDRLDANGSTYVDCGLDLANGIFGANPVPTGEKRNRVVIVFTDGAPGYNGEYSGRDYGSSGDAAAAANQALTKVSTTKNTYGATVYTVGIFSGADATSAGNDTGNATQRANWFMQTLSSNNGTPQKPSYYLSAADANSLNNIFQQISDQIETGGSGTTLGSEAVIKDIISPQFTLPAGATASNITLESYRYNGPSYNAANAWTKNATAMGAKATVNGDTVSVTGFDFAENWSGSETNAGNTSYHGNKLVISFTVSPKAGFLGGNNVYTNTSAGIYENGSAQTPVMTFNQPQVNVPIKDVSVTAEDKNVYLLSNLTADQLKSGATVKVGDVVLDLTKSDYGLADWQTAYVDITVEVKGANGNAVTDLTDLMDDTTYTVSVKVAPKYEALETSSGTSAMAKSNTGTGNINVFKPELTFQDSEVYYGDGVPTEYSNLTATKWKHGTTEANISEMGPAPTLSLIYTPDSTKIADDIINTKQDIAVDVTVKIGTADVTGNTTFQHTNCTGKICNVPVGKEFLLHVKTCQLTITKNGGANNEPYVFTVFKDDEKYSEVTVWGNGTETLVELPVGTYTIVEDTGWSWRFTGNNGSSATLKAQSPTGSITANNTLNNPCWLNGFSTVVKNIYAPASVEQ